MPVYELRPNPKNTNHMDWRLSDHKGDCFVSATDAGSARDHATLSFAIMAEKVEHGTTPINPWRQQDKVICVEIADVNALPHDIGSVWLPDGTDVTVRD